MASGPKGREQAAMDNRLRILEERVAAPQVPIALPVFAYADLPNATTYDKSLVFTTDGCDSYPGLLIALGNGWLQMPIGLNGTPGAAASDT